MVKVLIADDAVISIRILQEELTNAGYELFVAKDEKEALVLLQRNDFKVIFFDIQLLNNNGYHLLKEIKAKSKEASVVLIADADSIECATKAIKLGADDYIEKPYGMSDLLDKISHNIENRTNIININFEDENKDTKFYGNNIYINQIKETILKIKDINTTVLITGESGTGKGIIAKEIHRTSKRKNLPFILVDCAALPPNLIESELFGCEKGAFTSAVASRKGKFEQAEKGTVFLDEVGTLTPNLQSKLLIVLQEKYYYRVGGSNRIPMEARIISATNGNLEKSVENGTFREDLYYRLNVVRIETPPLRLRKDDISTLATVFINRFMNNMGKNIIGIENQFFDALQQYDWPGNIRELENALESAVALCDEDILKVVDLPHKITNGKNQSEFHLIRSDNISLKQQEKIAIASALEKCGGHRERTANYLGISRRTLQYKLKKFDLLDYGYAQNRI